ncbi:MAG TPA: hypothetical protein VIH22_14410 [Cyclobacteriaceae bacterium]|jgi:hypothetical protein
MSASTQVKLLISLAQIDGLVADRERNYISKIGVANGLTPDDMSKLFEQRHDLIVPADLSDAQKFDCLFHLVQLMKIDERMYREEILFCSTIAEKLGYRKEVMFDLMLNVKAGNMDENEKEKLEDLTRKYLV